MPAQLSAVLEAARNVSRDLGWRDDSTYSLAVMVGGTFTDIVLRHSSGALTVDKVLTTHHDLLEGFFAGVSNV